MVIARSIFRFESRSRYEQGDGDTMFVVVPRWWWVTQWGIWMDGSGQVIHEVEFILFEIWLPKLRLEHTLAKSGRVLSLSPSFNRYSNSKLVEIAARVVEEFRAEDHSEGLYDEFYPESEEIVLSAKSQEENQADSKNVEQNDVDGDEDEDFEFAFVTSDSEFSSSISADEIFYNGQIRPVFPIFNRDLLLGNETGNSDSSPKAAPIRLPLRKLFNDSETSSSSSSSEVDDLDGVPAATSHSDGDHGPLVSLSPSKQKENEKIKKSVETPVIGGGKVKAAAQYARNGVDRRRSYLPYRKDLVGFFANVNGLSRNA
ncbi:hypothetical protein Fot_29698 [Forsythia ovata]|uniref:Uncharacterized protein n=1 Tax=Forsythia ovata TaxID=205694 RepID=A0ABD1TSL1_9LAMI